MGKDRNLESFFYGSLQSWLLGKAPVHPSMGTFGEASGYDMMVLIICLPGPVTECSCFILGDRHADTDELARFRITQLEGFSSPCW